MFTRATCRYGVALYSQKHFVERDEAQQRPAEEKYFWCKSKCTPVNFLEALEGNSGALPSEPI